MEPMMSPRAQALRWLAISEKLLGGLDLVGSKTFAIRARESDPGLEAADQILAVADTLIAGEKRIPGTNYHDWYAILQLSWPTNDSELIATRYCRLALLLNPQKNILPFADQAFRLIIDAWSVLSNPSKKSFYDAHLNFYSQSEPNKTDSGARQDPQSSPWPPPPTAPQQQQQQTQQHEQRNQEEQPPQQKRKRGRPRLNKVQPPKQGRPGKGSNTAASSSSAASNIQEKINNVREEGSMRFRVHIQKPTFWTACPYCFNLYEYPRAYAEATLRCHKCEKAFQAVIIPEPQVPDGKGTYFFCWGHFPIGISPPDFEKNMGVASCWSPFSPLIACPGAATTKKGTKSSAPRVYFEDDDVFMEVSDSSGDSDDGDWRSSGTRKNRKQKGRGAQGGKNAKNTEEEKGGNVRGGNGEKSNSKERATGESSRKGASSNAKKPAGKTGKEWRRLDLNLEFNNEADEPTRGVRGGHPVGHGGEDNIEGISFFEGLDEFLKNLPILSDVKDDKVKAA